MGRCAGGRGASAPREDRSRGAPGMHEIFRTPQRGKDCNGSLFMRAPPARRALPRTGSRRPALIVRRRTRGAHRDHGVSASACRGASRRGRRDRVRCRTRAAAHVIGIAARTNDAAVSVTPLPPQAASESKEVARRGLRVAARGAAGRRSAHKERAISARTLRSTEDPHRVRQPARAILARSRPAAPRVATRRPTRDPL